MTTTTNLYLHTADRHGDPRTGETDAPANAEALVRPRPNREWPFSISIDLQQLARVEGHRAGFGVCFRALVWDGPGSRSVGDPARARWVWWTVALAGSAGFGGRSGHLEASYLNLLHLAPAVIALVVFAASLALLWPYLCRPSPPHRSQTR